MLTRSPSASSPSVVTRLGVRDEIDREVGGAVRVDDRVDGQRDAIDGDRSLGGEIRREVAGDPQVDAARVPVGADRAHLRDPVDMAGDDVAAELVAQPHRTLQVEAAALLPLLGGGTRHGLAGDVDHEPAALSRRCLVDHRQAYARTADRRAQVDAGGVIGGVDRHAHVAAVLDPRDGADVADDSGEHG